MTPNTPLQEAETQERTPVKEKMKVTIVIDGESAEELFAAGPIDLKDYFLPEHMNVNPDDVKVIAFRQVTERSEKYGIAEKFRVHKDNYWRDKDALEKQRDSL